MNGKPSPVPRLLFLAWLVGGIIAFVRYPDRWEAVLIGWLLLGIPVVLVLVLANE